MALILKVDFNGNVRRFRLELPENADLAVKWTLIMGEIRAGFKLAAGDDDFVLKYKDEEGDMCTLVLETLSDCLTQAAAGPVRLVACHPASADEPSLPGMPCELDSAKLLATFMAAKKMSKTCTGKGKGKCGWKCPWWQQDGTAQVGQCPGGHDLSEQSLCGVCDKCGTGFSYEDAVMGCRLCNWDLCEGCFKEQGIAKEVAKDQDASKDAEEAGAEAPSSKDSDWTPELFMGSWEDLFAHLQGKGKCKGKWGKCKGKWGKGMCGKGWGGMPGGEGHQEGHHFDAATFWQNLAAMGQVSAAQPEMFDREPHMHERMGADAGQPYDPLAFWAQSPWGQTLAAAIAQSPAPRTEDTKKATEQPEEGKKGE